MKFLYICFFTVISKKKLWPSCNPGDHSHVYPYPILSVIGQQSPIRVGFLGVQGAKPPYRGLGCPQCFSFFLSPPEAACKKNKKRFSGTPQYCSNKNTSSIRDRKKGRKEDKEAVQMAY